MLLASLVLVSFGAEFLDADQHFVIESIVANARFTELDY